MNQNIITFIENRLEKGESIDLIKGHLKGQGNSPEVIESCFGEVIKKRAKNLHPGISDMINLGYSLFEIRRHFINQGYDYRIVDNAIKKFEGSHNQIPPPPSNNPISSDIRKRKIQHYINEQLNKGFTIIMIKSVLLNYYGDKEVELAVDELVLEYSKKLEPYIKKMKSLGKSDSKIYKILLENEHDQTIIDKAFSNLLEFEEKKEAKIFTNKENNNSNNNEITKELKKDYDKNPVNNFNNKNEQKIKNSNNQKTIKKVNIQKIAILLISIIFLVVIIFSNINNLDDIKNNNQTIDQNNETKNQLNIVEENDLFVDLSLIKNQFNIDENITFKLEIEKEKFDKIYNLRLNYYIYSEDVNQVFNELEKVNLNKNILIFKNLNTANKIENGTYQIILDYQLDNKSYDNVIKEFTIINQSSNSTQPSK
jgi:hypothetical protein